MGNLTAKTSGEIASFMSPSMTNIKSLKVHFSPKQLGTGDPSPENVREIVGWDGVEVNGSGKNLFGGEAFASIVSPSLLKEDEYGKYIRINNATNTLPIFTMPFKENTQYTFIGKIRRNVTSNTSALRIKYTDNTWSVLFSSTNKDEIKILKTTSLKNKTVEGLYYLQRTINFDIYYDTFGIFEGDIPIESYKPYQGNNISYQWKLPDEYQEVEYIEKTDYNQYIDTGVLGDGELQFKCKLNITQIKNGSPFFGSYGNSQRCYFLIQNNNNIGYSYITSEYSSTTLETNKDYNINVIFKAGEQQLYIDNNIVLTTTKTGTIKTEKNIFLFGYNFDGHFDVERSSFIKLYNAMLYKDNVLVRNFIPCYRKSDNEIGMYDTVSQTFYTNQGTGTFLKGNDVDKTFYGGYVDLISGELVEEYGKYIFTGDENIQWHGWGDDFYIHNYVTGSNTSLPFKSTDNTYCNMSIPVKNRLVRMPSGNMSISGTNGLPSHTYIICSSYGFGETLEDCKAKLSELYSNGTPYTVVSELKDIFKKTYQLTPTQLSSFIGQNNFWSNADYVEIEYDLIETEDIQKCRKKIMLNQPHTESVIDDVVNFTTNMKAPLKECKVYFNPIQEGSGDPSPDNIRNIVGWDGVNVGLPDEYQEVEYIESTGTQYIKTDIKSRPIIEYESVLEFTNGGDQYTVGFRDGNFRAVGNGYYSSKTQIAYNTTYKLGAHLSLNKKYKYKTCLKPNEQNVFLDDEMVASYDLPQTETVLSDKHVGIFCQLSNDTTPQFLSKIKLTSLAIKENDLLLGNFIPCYRKSDGEIGMYDTVSKTFYTNSGRGTFLKGDDVNTIIGNVNWSDEVGTVYGGYVDLAKGELVAEWYKLTFDGINQKMNKDYTDDTYIRCYEVYFSPVGVKGSSILCNNLPLFIQTAVTKTPCFWSANNGKKFGGIVLGTKEEYPDLAEATAQQRIDYVNNWLKENPTTVVYKLAEPIHYQLTPQQLLTFKETNNIWSNSNGRIEVKFWTH